MARRTATRSGTRCAGSTTVNVAATTEVAVPARRPTGDREGHHARREAGRATLAARVSTTRTGPSGTRPPAGRPARRRAPPGRRPARGG